TLISTSYMNISFLFYAFLFLFFFFFFFSSRRRHTRSLRDWSSDVCSSDLESQTNIERSAGRLDDATEIGAPFPRGLSCFGAIRRSEERRVGKECRSRWSTEQ